MTSFVRAASALLLAVAATAAFAQEPAGLEGERERISYMMGMDVGRSFAAVGPDIDFAQFERALRHALDGGEPLISEQDAAALAGPLRQRAAARAGRPIPGMAPGSQPPATIDTAKVGLMLGADAGRSLAPLRDEIDAAVLVRGVRALALGQTPLLSPEQARQAAEALNTRIQARAAAAAGDNRRAGNEFLAGNRSAKGVFATPSGLQYMVLRQGSGRRPMISDRVRVQYRGSLLDGTVFDSSYDRGAPAEFQLRQLISGWTEGLMLMPIGAKYRFWVPGELGYGEAGSPPAIGPNALLVFDVELLDIL